MKTGLPARDEYYRPARARELRREARRLRRRSVLLRSLSVAAVVTGVLTAVGIADLWASLLVVMAALIGLALLTAGRALRSSAARMELEASSLDGQHQARYGALPAGDE